MIPRAAIVHVTLVVVVAGGVVAVLVVEALVVEATKRAAWVDSAKKNIYSNKLLRVIMDKNTRHILK